MLPLPDEARLRAIRHEVEVAARHTLDGDAVSITVNMRWALALQEELVATQAALERDQHECHNLLAENSMARAALRQIDPEHPQLRLSAVRVTAAELISARLPGVGMASAGLPVAAAVPMNHTGLAAATRTSHAREAAPLPHVAPSMSLPICEPRVATSGRGTHVPLASASHEYAAGSLPTPFPFLSNGACVAAGPARGPTAPSERWFPAAPVPTVALTPFMADVPSPLAPADVLSTPNLRVLATFLDDSGPAGGASISWEGASRDGCGRKFQRIGVSARTNSIGSFDALASSGRRNWPGRGGVGR